MSVFDFVKEAGEKLFGGKKQEETRKPGEDAERAAMLTDLVSTLGLKIQNLRIDVNESLATIRGTALSQPDREKAVLVVGNTQGIARVDDQMLLEQTVPEPPATMYTVKSGDSLSKIAKAHYGNASKYMTIFEANRPMLKDPNKIYPGQVLRIPRLEG